MKFEALPKGTVLVPVPRVGGKEEVKKPNMAEDKTKQLESETRSLRIKLKSVESQISKNDAEAAAKLAKHVSQLFL